MTAILNNISSFTSTAVRKTWAAIRWTAKTLWAGLRMVTFITLAVVGTTGYATFTSCVWLMARI